MSALGQLNQDLEKLHDELKSRQLESAAADVDIMRGILGQQILGVAGPYETEVVVGDKTLAKLLIPEGIDEDAVNALIRTFVDEARAALAAPVTDEPPVEAVPEPPAPPLMPKPTAEQQKNKFIETLVEMDHEKEEKLFRPMFINPTTTRQVPFRDKEFPDKYRVMRELIDQITPTQMAEMQRSFGLFQLEIIPTTTRHRLTRVIETQNLPCELSQQIKDALHDEESFRRDDGIAGWRVGIIDGTPDLPIRYGNDMRDNAQNILALFEANKSQGILPIHPLHYLMAQARAHAGARRLDDKGVGSLLRVLDRQPANRLNSWPVILNEGVDDATKVTLKTHSIDQQLRARRPVLGFRGEFLCDRVIR